MSPLIDRLTTDLGWPLLDSLEDFEAYIASPGAHAIFVPGDPTRNLESNDVAVILPELVMHHQRAFDAAVAGTAIEAQIRELAKTFQTPSLLFYRDGAFLGAIPKVRDWDDYMTRIAHILQPEAA